MLQKVYQVRHKRTNELFAIKKSTRRFASKAHRQRWAILMQIINLLTFHNVLIRGLYCRCLHEIMAVAALPAHPNIVGQYRAWQQGGHFNIEMELCEGGSLAELLLEVHIKSSGFCQSDAQQCTHSICSCAHDAVHKLQD